MCVGATLQTAAQTMGQLIAGRIITGLVSELTTIRSVVKGIRSDKHICRETG
jgi:hypothetical protein